MPNIFFTASYPGKKKYQKYYDLILETLEKNCDVVISPEKNNYLEYLPKGLREKLSKDRYELHYAAIRHDIQYSDATVIEISNEDFQLGHEATLAIQSKKHVLCLSLYENFERKIKNEYFHGARYNANNLDMVVKDFLESVQKKKLQNRFNMFLSDQQLSHLNSCAEQNNKNLSEYVRWLIEKDMKKNSD